MELENKLDKENQMRLTTQKSEIAQLLIGDGTDDKKLRILEQIGFKEELKEQRLVIENKITFDKLSEQYGTKRIYNLNSIARICDKYYMNFFGVEKNTDKNIDINAVTDSIIEFTKKFNIEIEHVSNSFYVMTTVEGSKNKPFMLFYKDSQDSQEYILIYSSKTLIKERRIILGKIFDNDNSFGVFVFISITTFLIGILALTTNLLSTFINHYIGFTVLSILVLLILVAISTTMTTFLFIGSGGFVYNKRGEKYLLNNTKDINNNYYSIISKLFIGMHHSSSYTYKAYLKLKSKKQ